MNDAHTMHLAPPRFVDGKRMLIAGLVERYSRTTAGIPAQWQRFAPYIGKLPEQIGRASYGVIFDSLQGQFSFGYLTGVEVAGIEHLPEEFGHLEIPAQRYAVFAHSGHVSALPDTCHAIGKEWLPESGVDLAGDGVDFFERYGENFNPESGTGGMEIWFPVKP